MSTHSSRVIAALSLAICLRSHGADGQNLSASDVLRKVDQAYRQVSSFSVVAEKEVDRDTNTITQAHIDPKGIRVGTHESDFVQITLMASNSSKAKLLLKSGKKEIVAVCDGKTIWTLIPAQHEYTEVAARRASIDTPVYTLRIGNSDLSGEDLLRDYATPVAVRLRSISGYESWAKLERSETLKVGKGKKECYVLTIQAPGSVEKQKLWVDKTEFTIWKSVDTTQGPWDPYETLQTKVTVTLKQLVLNPSLDDSNFVLTVPNKARKVASLQVSGSNPF